MANCKHPPTRLYSGYAYNPDIQDMDLWIACCECGEILKNSYKEPNCGTVQTEYYEAKE